MRFKSALASLGILVCSPIAQAGAPQPFSDDLFLDWDGLRSELRGDGIDFRVGYISETATNVQGGDKELWRYADQWTFAATLDLQKLIGLDQAQFRITITDRNGRNLSADAHLDDLQQVQETYGNNETWYLTQFWYDQKYLGGKLDWKIGRLTEGEDFAAFSCEFMNFTFCGSAPGNIAGSYWYNWPVSQWATRVKVSVSGFGYVQLGAFEVNPSYLLTRYALDPGDPPGATGVLVPAEIGWLPTFGSGSDGSYKFGAWYNSSKAPDVVENTNGQPLAIAGGEPLMRHGEYGAYFNFLQHLTRPLTGASKQGVSVFLNGIYADRWTSTLDSQIAAGVLYTGPFTSRPEDETGFAVGRTHVNNRVSEVERLQNAVGRTSVGVQSAEYVGELFYKVQATPWLDLRPSIQYIHDPGGVAKNTNNNLIVGLRLSVNF
jgi:porin